MHQSKHSVAFFSFLHAGKMLTDPKLCSIALSIPSLLLKSRADGTINTYMNSFKQWEKWTDEFDEVQSMPADSVYIAIYFAALIQQGSSFHKIKNTFYAIAWFHNINNFDNPCNNRIVKGLYEAAKRILSKPRIKKLPITPYHLIKIVKMNDNRKCVKQTRLVALFLIGYAGFFRYQELVNIRKGDIIIYKNFMRIFVEKSKCDQYRTGKWIFIAKTNNLTCPVRAIKKYLSLIQVKSKEFIFRSLTYFKSKNLYKLRKSNSPISYSTARDIVLNAIEKIGINKKFFGTHSLRSGGATAAAKFGVSDRLFKQHGRWKSENAKDGYVESSLKDLLSVSKNLGI